MPGPFPAPPIFWGKSPGDEVDTVNPLFSPPLKWMNEWMNEWVSEEPWMRGQQTCPLTIHVNMWTVSSDVSIQGCRWQPLSVHLWDYCTHPAHDVNDVICESWPQHRGLRPLLFSNSGVGSFTSHNNQISVRAVRRDLRFFVLIRGD